MTSSTPNMFINNQKHKLKPADSFKLKPKHKSNFIKTNILSNQFGTVSNIINQEHNIIMNQHHQTSCTWLNIKVLRNLHTCCLAVAVWRICESFKISPSWNSAASFFSFKLFSSKLKPSFLLMMMMKAIFKWLGVGEFLEKWMDFMKYGRLFQFDSC